MAQYMEDFLRLLLAFLLGGIIGFQREWGEKPAGMRTHILVSLASAMMMIVAEHSAEITGFVDPTRISAAIITGIGFLGAGTIIREREKAIVHGLTTAASVWTVACIGIASGQGYYFVAITGTLLVFIVLHIFGKIEHLISEIKSHKKLKQNRKKTKTSSSLKN